MLVNADARQIPLQDGSVQLIVTSPPYYNAKLEYASWGSYGAYLDEMQAVWSECYHVLCDGGRIAVNTLHGYDRPGCGGYKPIEVDTTIALVRAGFELRGHIIWNKKGLSPQTTGTQWGSWMSAKNPSLRDGHEVIIVAHKGDAGRAGGEDTIDRDMFLAATRSIWDICPVSQSWHPAPFPAEIPRRLIELYSFVGDVVLDPFVGSGTTVLVADKLGRRGIGLDLKWEYLERARYDTALQAHEWDVCRELQSKPRPTMVSDLPMFAVPEAAS